MISLYALCHITQKYLPQPVTISYNSKMQNKIFYPQLMMKSKKISEEEEQLTKRRRKKRYSIMFLST